jgi:hypothetical protein
VPNRDAGGTFRFPQTPSTGPLRGHVSATLRRVQIPRRLERFILGTMMNLVALVAERRVVKALGKKSR